MSWIEKYQALHTLVKNLSYLVIISRERVGEHSLEVASLLYPESSWNALVAAVETEARCRYDELKKRGQKKFMSLSEDEKLDILANGLLAEACVKNILQDIYRDRFQYADNHGDCSKASVYDFALVLDDKLVKFDVCNCAVSKCNLITENKFAYRNKLDYFMLTKLDKEKKKVEVFGIIKSDSLFTRHIVDYSRVRQKPITSVEFAKQLISMHYSWAVAEGQLLPPSQIFTEGEEAYSGK